MPRSTNLSDSTMGIDIGKNSFHVVGLDQAMDYRREEATASQRAGRRARARIARAVLSNDCDFKCEKTDETPRCA